MMKMHSCHDLISAGRDFLNNWNRLCIMSFLDYIHLDDTTLSYFEMEIHALEFF